MARIVSWPDPTGVNPIPEAFARWTGLSIGPIERSIRVTYGIWRDRHAHDAGKRQVDSADYTLAGTDLDAFLTAHPEAVAMIDGLVDDFVANRPEFSGSIVADG